MTWVAGADGCKHGWAVALRDIGNGCVLVRIAGEVGEILEWPERVERLCLDIPIGLLDAAVPGGRACDREAKLRLKWPRSSSVFSPPVRRTLDAGSFEEAVKRNRASSPHRIGISIQSYAIMDKIRQVDRFMTPALQERVREVHPEVTFWGMNGGQAMAGNKKKAAGRAARCALLEKAWNKDIRTLVEEHSGKGVGRDDIVDAMAACWTAERIVRGCAETLPAEPPVDSRGLRMEIVW